MARLDARNRIATLIEKLAHYKNLSSKLAPLILTESTSAFHSTNLFLFSRHHIPNNSVAPLSAFKLTHKPQILQSLWRRANARKVSFFTLYGGQFTFSTQLLTLNYQSFKCFFFQFVLLVLFSFTSCQKTYDKNCLSFLFFSHTSSLVFVAKYVIVVKLHSRTLSCR